MAELFSVEYGDTPNLTRHARIEINGMQIHSMQYSRPTNIFLFCISFRRATPT